MSDTNPCLRGPPQRTFSITQCNGKPTCSPPSGWKLVSSTEPKDTGNTCLVPEPWLLGIKTKRRIYQRSCTNEKITINPANKLACCMGIADNPFDCEPTWCKDKRNCDTDMINYCSKPVDQRPAIKLNGVTQTVPSGICGCLLPIEEYGQSGIFGPPHCVDKRCIDQKAYKTEQDKIPCAITNCVIRDIKILAENSTVDIDQLKQECGAAGIPFRDETAEAGEAGSTTQAPAALTPTTSGAPTPAAVEGEGIVTRIVNFSRRQAFLGLTFAQVGISVAVILLFLVVVVLPAVLGGGAAAVGGIAAPVAVAPFRANLRFFQKKISRVSRLKKRR